MLSIEPVHIYTDPDVTPTTSASIVHAFDRERKLQDIAADGTNVFETRKPASVQLSEDVRRLWAERGDFSRFRTSDLLKKRARDAEQQSTSSSDADDDDEEAGQGKAKDDREEEALLRPPGERVGGTIAESQFVELRNKVLGNLDVAHFNSIHAHQLLGMLIKQHRSATTSAAASGSAAARMGSPAPSTGAQSARSGSTAPVVPKAPLGLFSHLTPANREEEFVLDPLAISLSRTSLNASTAARRTLNADEDADNAGTGALDDDEFDHDPSSAAYGLRQARREMEGAEAFKADRLREFKVVLETKRKAIANAAELLSSAAAELRESHAPNRERWRALIGLHGRGWGLTPGRPLLDVERFGVDTGEEDEEDDAAREAEIATENGGEEQKKTAKKEEKEGKKPAGLQGFGTPIITSDGKVKDEGARDAWIGFGLPEAPIELRRRSIAYWADLTASSSSATASASADEVKRKLVFPDRMHRRLRVRFVLWPPSTSSARTGEGDPEGEGRREWSSDPTATASAPSDGAQAQSSGAVVVGQILDQELQDASREASDELVFGDVVAQARLLPPSFGVRLTASSVRVVLTKRLDLVVELVPSTAAAGEEGKAVGYAPHAALLLAFLRLGPLRKYQAFVAATQLGRRADAAARAAAIKAVALAVPKKSSGAAAAAAAGTGGVGTANDSAGRGIAAGGKATSSALGRLDTLGPVLVGLHYWSFVHRLGTVLRELQSKTETTGLVVRVQLVPVTPAAAASERGASGPRSQTLSELVAVLGRLVDATGSQRYVSTPGAPHSKDGLHSIYRPSSASVPDTAATEALHGFAKVFVTNARGTKRGHSGQRLVCTLSFRQPSLLSVQFAPPPSNGHAPSLTNKPLPVDLDTLATLLSQRLALYA